MTSAVSDTSVPVASIIASLLYYTYNTAGAAGRAATDMERLRYFDLAGQPLIALLLKLQRQIGAAGLDDAAPGYITWTTSGVM